MPSPEALSFTQTVVGVIAVVVALAAAGVALWQLREAQRQRRLALGQQYIERYWQVTDDLLHSPKGTDEHRRHQHRYLLLCEDEFEGANGRWFEASMWETWHSWLASAQGRELLTADLRACAHAEAPFESVRACLQGEVGHAWAACPGNQDGRSRRA